YERLSGRTTGSLIGTRAPFPDWGPTTEEAFARGVREAMHAIKVGKLCHHAVPGEIVHVSGQSVPVTMEIALVVPAGGEPNTVVTTVRPRGRVPWLDRRKRDDVDERVVALEGALRSIAGEVARLGVAPIGIPKIDDKTLGRLSLSPQEWRII